MRIKWLKEAEKDLDSVHEYINQQDKPNAAVATIIKIIDSVKALAAHPVIGRVGRVAGTRELIITDLPYIIPYRIKKHTVEVLRVLHTSRLWPENF